MDLVSPVAPSRRIYLNKLPSEESSFIGTLHSNINTSLSALNFSAQIEFAVTIRNNCGFIQISLCDEDAHEVAKRLNDLPIIFPDTFLLANVPSQHNKKAELAKKSSGPPVNKEKQETRKQQKLKRREKRFDMLGSFFASMPSPGGANVLKMYKKYSDLAALRINSPDDYLEGKGSVDWSLVPKSVDPGYNYLLGIPLGDNPLIETRATGERVPEVDTLSTSRAVIGRSSALIATPGLYHGLTTRALRKRAQTESFVLVLRPLLAMLTRAASEKASYNQPCHIVDFGSGSGNLCLALAFLFPACTFTAVDFKKKSVEILNQRAIAAGLKNVRGIVGKIEDFQEPFDVCLALHACGVATDYALQQACRCRAAYIVCPCCVGNLKYSAQNTCTDTDTDIDIEGEAGDDELLSAAERTLSLKPPRTSVEGAVFHPRSKWMSKVLSRSRVGPAREVYTALARAGDIAHGSAHSSSQGHSHTHEAVARLCKSHLELDRSKHMEEAGYQTALMQLLLSELTGKGDLLVGLPSEWTIGTGNLQLPWMA